MIRRAQHDTKKLHGNVLMDGGMLYIKCLSVGTLMDYSSPSLHFIQLLLPIHFSFTLPASYINHVSLVRSPEAHPALRSGACVGLMPPSERGTP